MLRPIDASNEGDAQVGVTQPKESPRVTICHLTAFLSERLIAK